ncbi:hypothetical protein [Helicobacter sp. T3_23-1056]
MLQKINETLITDLDTSNQNPKRYDKNGDEILWEGKRKYHPAGVFQYMLYFIVGAFFMWFSWILVFKISLWWLIFAISYDAFMLWQMYNAINFKSIHLTQKGLVLTTRFGGDICYLYGDFVIRFDIPIGIRFCEDITITNTKQQNRTFPFPCGYDSFGSFENNQDFKEICTTKTQHALESMDIDKKAYLYKIYTLNVGMIFNEERNSNVFIIDFLPYKKEIEHYLNYLKEQNGQPTTKHL